MDNCEVPSGLSQFQWIQLEEPCDFSPVLDAISHQNSVIRNEKKAFLGNYSKKTIIEQIIQGSYGDISPKQLYEIRYQLIDHDNNSDYEEVNILIKNEILQCLLSARHNYFNYIKGNRDIFNASSDDETSGLFLEDSTKFVRISTEFISNKLFSYTSFSSTYITGAAHGNFGTSGYSFLLNPLRRVMLFDMIIEDNDINVSRLCSLILSKLKEKAKIEYELDRIEDFLFEGKIPLDRDFFNNFYLTTDTIHFIFNPYKIAAYCFGEIRVEIKLEELSKVFTDDPLLAVFVKAIS